MGSWAWYLPRWLDRILPDVRFGHGHALKAMPPQADGSTGAHAVEGPRDPGSPGDQMKDAINRVGGSRWLQSDLVGITATLYTFAVLAISLAVFRFAGPFAGIVVGVAVWLPMLFFAIRERGQPPAPLGLTDQTDATVHRVLVIANQGLEDPALCREVCRREERAATEVMIVAPVVATSRLRGLAGDVDQELDAARSGSMPPWRRSAPPGCGPGGGRKSRSRSMRCAMVSEGSRRTKS